MAPAPAPKLSVVVGNIAPWPAIRGCFEHLQDPVRSLGAELIVADGTGQGLPPDGLPGVRHLVLPGATVFELRARGIEASRGEIVAVTEDHVWPAPDWCERLLAAHAAHPEADIVSGAVLNGPERGLFNRADFLMLFAPQMPPLDASARQRVPPHANIAYKRRALPARLEPGELELRVARRLRDEGKVVYDDRALVRHVQWYDSAATIYCAYHNGRATTGLARATMRRREKLSLLLKAGWRPLILARAILDSLKGKSLPRSFTWPVLPALLTLTTAHVAGETVGLLRGPGRSPSLLH